MDGLVSAQDPTKSQFSSGLLCCGWAQSIDSVPFFDKGVREEKKSAGYVEMAAQMVRKALTELRQDFREKGYAVYELPANHASHLTCATDDATKLQLHLASGPSSY